MAVHALDPAIDKRSSGLHDAQGLWIAPQVRKHGGDEAEVADAGSTAEQVRVDLEVRIKRIEELAVHLFDSRLGFVRNTKGLTRLPHFVRGCFRHFGLLGAGREQVAKSDHDEAEVLLGEVPAIVHRRAQQPLSPNHVHQ